MNRFKRFWCMLLISSVAIGVQQLPAQWKLTPGVDGGFINTMLAFRNGSGGWDLLAGTNGAGVFLSTDRGASWTASNTGISNPYIVSFAVDTITAGGPRLFVGTSSSLLISTNMGSTWTPAMTGMESQCPLSLAVLPNGSGGAFLYASTYVGVFKSTNSGSNWSTINNGLGAVTVQRVAAVDTGGGSFFLFAATQTGVYRSTNGGSNWGRSDTGISNKNLMFITAFSGGRELYASGLGGLYKSTNFGAVWTVMSSGIQFANAIAKIGTALYVSSAGGLSETTNGGTSWIYAAAGLFPFSVNSVMPVPNGVAGTDLVAGSPGGSYLLPAGSSTWNPIFKGLAATDVTGLTRGSNGYLLASTSYSGLLRSADDGQNWSPISPPPDSHTYSALASCTDSAGTTFEFLGSYYSLQRSQNNGTNWTELYPNLPSNNGNIALIYPVPNGSGGSTVFVGIPGSGVYRSTDYGAQWTARNQGLTNTSVTAFASQGKYLFVTAAVDGGVYRSSNGGANWIQVNAGLTNPDARAIQSNGSELYVGTSGGVFRSTNNGDSWLPTGSMSDPSIGSIAFAGSTVIAGSFAGMVYTSVNSGGTWSLIDTTLVGCSIRGIVPMMGDRNTMYALTGGQGLWRRPMSDFRNPNAPFIVSVKDVPADQGGRVSISWLASALDTNLNALVKYQVWRSTPQRSASMTSLPPPSSASVPALRKTTTTASGQTIAWEWIADIIPHKFAAYSYTCPTLYDSVSVTNGMHLFLVSAQTNNINLFYNSDPDSGYSVDNIPPFAPQNILGSVQGTSVALHWNANGEPDLKNYVVYRSPAAIGDPASLQPCAQVADTQYVDATPLPGVANYYVVCAVDVHGNRSTSGNQVAVVTTGVVDNGAIPKEYILGQNFPNPFNPSTTIRFGLPVRSSVLLTVYNAMGQRVATLINANMDAGYHEARFDAGSLASGLYLYRLQAGTHVETKKLVVLK